jgi:predicted CopG family antitoxin
MAIKTISLKKEAYDRLRNARRFPSESFSEIVLRATWPEDTVTGRALLDHYGTRATRLSDAELERMIALKRRDAPPEDKWADR